MEGDTITIHLEITVFDTSVSSAEAVICLDGICLPPKDMFEQDEDTYSLEIGPYEAGQTVTYNVVVEDSEGNILESSEKEFNIREAVAPPDDDDPAADDDSTPGEDDSTGDVQSSGIQSEFIIAGVVIGIIIMVVVVIIVFALNRGKKSDDESMPLHDLRPSPVYAGELADDGLELETGVQVK